MLPTLRPFAASRAALLHVRFVLPLVLLLLFGVSASAKVLYVKSAGNDSASGLTWNDAKKSVSVAITASQSGDEIWVSSGTFTGTIRLKAGVGLYGGFAGTESDRTGRDFRRNATVLDGGRTGVGGVTGSVVTVPEGAVLSTVLEGFTIRNGYAENGGGLYCRSASPTIRYCVFDGNEALLSGGGAYFETGAPQVSSCTFRNNLARQDKGGAIFVSGGAATISGCVVSNNGAGSDGGGIHVFESDVRLVNNTLVSNTCGNIGGGIALDATVPGDTMQLVNNIVAFNSTGVGVAGVATPDFRANCVYGNLNADYVGVPSQTGINGNLSTDPLLASVAGVNLHLQPNSPCRNAGDSGQAVDLIDIDLQPRLQGAAVDIGADESNGATWSTNARRYYVHPGGDDQLTGLTWKTAKQTITGAIAAAQPGDEIWAAAGIYPERILLKTGIRLYGGFGGNETQLSQRDWRSQQAILISDGSGVVVTIPVGCSAETLLDGFTMQGGEQGLAVVAASPVIRHCVFTDNHVTGSGAGVSLTSSVVRISQCGFWINSASIRGGGLNAYKGDVTLSSCVFTNNSAVQGGGALFVSGTNLRVLNSTLARNVGDAVKLDDCSALLANNIIAFNSGSGITSRLPNQLDVHVEIRSNCVYQNTGGNYTYLGDYTGANGNVSFDPRFVAVNLRNVHLLADSPCRDRGNDSLVWDDEDLDGQARVFGSAVDIGADEFVPVGSVLVTLTPSSITGSVVNPTGSVTLDEAAPAGGAVVMLRSSDTDAATVPESVTVPEGQRQAVFAVTGKLVPATTRVTIEAACGEAVGSAVLTVHAVYQARDIALAGDGSVRILQVNGDYARILKVTGASLQFGTPFPIPAGWTPVAITVTGQGKALILWSGPGGAVSVMTMNSSGVREAYRVVGSYPGVVSRDIGVTFDGAVSILQVSAGLVRILVVDGSTVRYGKAQEIPAGWTPTAIACADTSTHLLWNGPGGAVSLMTFDSLGVRSAYRVLGAYPGVTARDIAVGGEGTTTLRILQASASLARILKVDGPTLQYGPAVQIPDGWTPTAVASGVDSLSRLLWTCTDGRLGVMTMNASGAREAYMAMGPY